MQFNDVMIPAVIFAVLGVVFGVLLAIAAKIFAVKVDERVPQITECLPGANCGGCGFSGCAALADAIVKGEAAPNACNACSAEGMRRIGEIMGIEVSDPVPMYAQVMCSGNCNTAVFKYRYEGAADCIAAEKLGGGDKACPNGCIGLGTCVAACKYDAISIQDGLAVVDPEKCIGCGACASVCPKHLIAVIPVASKYVVACRSVENGATTRRQCAVGCISCRICEKNCPAGAVTVNDFVASIDQNKCTGCGICAEKCPRKIIKKV
ncbi:MAG: RnfABCDGE type electron transport complex subunit B [Ruminococcaceae bacterium]|nr:RnfABCDGE type electron transport complex subunit B [Oscillospiraceae bacterium]